MLTIGMEPGDPAPLYPGFRQDDRGALRAVV